MAAPAVANTMAQRVQACTACPGSQGEGQRTADGQLAYPTLAGNRAATLGRSANLLTLCDADIAAVLTHVRTAWGNRAEPVSELDVQRLRGASTR